MKRLVEGSIAEVRTARHAAVPRTVFALAPFIEEARVDAQLEADSRGCAFVVPAVDPMLRVQANRGLLHGALSNLLVNAFKFTHRHTPVRLVARVVAGQVRIEVEDRCGGLQSGDTEALFTAGTPQGPDPSGLGLGLSIARQSMAQMGGSLTVENLPGVGCIVSLQLQRAANGHSPES
jgi:signal transduction histidine kinase